MSETKNKILNALNTYTPIMRENLKTTFVTLQSGKGLSAEDFTNDFKNKLTSIESGAQVNKIENISVNGVNASIDNKTAQITLSGGSDNNFTDDFKNKLTSIESGAQVNKIENISVTGGEFSFNTETKTANITISGGMENFTVNGAAVTAMSVTGAASVTSVSDTAIVSITGAEAKNVTINGAEAKNVTINGAESNIISISGAANVSLDTNNVTHVILPEPGPKFDAQFSLSSSAVTLPAFQPATISASHNGDGIVTFYADNKFITAEQLNATDFRIAAKYIGEGDVGFWLSETTSLYGAAKNCHVTVQESNMPVLMHFDNTASIWYENEGYVTFTGDNTATSDGGKFDRCFNAVEMYTLTPTNSFVLGGKDFTVDFWNKSKLGVFRISTAREYLEIYVPLNDNRYNVYSGSIKGYITAPTQITSEWQHLAVVYQHSAGLLKFYVGGVLQGSLNLTITRQDITFIQLAKLDIDELRILDGVAAWTSDFTPPSHPY